MLSKNVTLKGKRGASICPVTPLVRYIKEDYLASAWGLELCKKSRILRKDGCNNHASISYCSVVTCTDRQEKHVTPLFERNRCKAL